MLRLIPLLLGLAGLIAAGAARAQEAAPSDAPLLSAPPQGAANVDQQPQGDATESDDGQTSGLHYFDLNDDGTVTFTEAALTVWRMPLYDGGNGQVVRFNQIVLALLVVVVGIWISRRLTFILRRRLVRFRRIDVHVATFIQKVLFYALVVLICLSALPFVGIPITTLTVIGGALAIGIGFGAQAIINNLMSGMIIMTERPIRLGDIIELEDAQGRVEEIGNRATRVRRSDGIDVIVPNSQFVETPVVNWTLSDDEVRCSVVVGVAYGSRTDQVARLMRQAVDELDTVLKAPEPEVLFEEFGDNALLFNVQFWTRVTRPIDRRRIESAVRFRVDDLFREAGITIAFPQRDVHLDSLKPVEVRVIGSSGDSQDAGA